MVELATARTASASAAEARGATPALEVRGLTVRAGRRGILAGVDLAIAPGEVLCLLGPSGVGKSTLLKCLNRLIDLEPGLAVTGEVLLDGETIYRRRIDADRLRRRVGMLFQRPAIFPQSIFANAAFGLRHAARAPRREWPETVERVLREVALWDEVADRLDEPAATLSVGQQQRLCLARALALDPRVILMDEPTSALDPGSTRTIERLVGRLAGERTIVLVTHDPEQARRVADRVACVSAGPDGGRVAACTACDNLLDDDPHWQGFLRGVEPPGGQPTTGPLEPTGETAP